MVKDLWETLESSTWGNHTYRMKVAHGWIVKVEGHNSLALCFYHDPLHEWKVEHEPEPAPAQMETPKTRTMPMESPQTTKPRALVIEKKQGFWARFFKGW